MSTYCPRCGTNHAWTHQDQPDPRRAAAETADQTLEHLIVTEVMAELRMNLRVPDDGLEAYGIAKVATTAAQVAWAITKGHNPDILLLTPDEARSHLLERAAQATYDGVPTILLDDDPPPEEAKP